jgi:hypothetical protein
MPPKSKRQARFMRAVASGKVRKKAKGLTKKEAQEFVSGHPTKGLPETARKKKKKKRKRS